VQARGLELPRYEIIEKIGPDHAPSFVVQLSIEGQEPMTATGSSRRVAEKTVARKMLKVLNK